MWPGPNAAGGSLRVSLGLRRLSHLPAELADLSGLQTCGWSNVTLRILVWIVLAAFRLTASAPSQTGRQLLPATAIMRAGKRLCTAGQPGAMQEGGARCCLGQRL